MAPRPRFLARPLFALLAAAVILAGCETETRDTDIKLISVGQVKTLLDRKQAGRPNEVLLIDPRPTKSFDAGHLPGARNLLLPQVDTKGTRDPRIEAHGTIVVYGDDPASAAARGMTKRLMAVGYRGVRFFAGGLKEWRKFGYPVESNAPVVTPPQPAPAAEPAAAPAPTGG